MKTLFTTVFATCIFAVFSQYQGPIPKPVSGYGADGNHPVAVTELVNNHWLTEKIRVFHPADISTKVPTIFYSHGFGGNDTTYNRETFRHIASKGYAVVFVPYKTLGVDIPERYATLRDGFNKAARNLTNIIDTTRVGFMGQSFGGGATPGLALQAFTNNNWGSNGRFIYCSAPWYSFELGTNGLAQFPQDCNMLTVLYDEDATNDHRLGMDIFRNIAIPDSKKDCLMTYSTTIGGYTYMADHTLPAQYTNTGEFDVFDYVVTARLFAALAEFTFTGNATAGNIALGNGSLEQITLGSGLTPLSQTDLPDPTHPQSFYQFKCDTIINERKAFCMVLNVENNEFKPITVYPNPTTGIVHFDFEEPTSIEIREISGKVLFSGKVNEYYDFLGYAPGIYIISSPDTAFRSLRVVKE